MHLVNSGSIAVATVCTPGGIVDYEGEARIDGVPGRSAPVPLAFLGIAGASCGALLPTGNPVDVVGGIELTCIDNGMPVALLRAGDVGVTGREAPRQLEANAALKARVETLRLQVGRSMNLGDVASKSVPKMCLIAAPERGGAIATRTFIPHRVHESIGVLGAVSVATACALPGTVAHALATIDALDAIDVEHPSGAFTIGLEFDRDGAVVRSSLLRTARKLFHGEVYVPAQLYRQPARGSDA